MAEEFLTQFRANALGKPDFPSLEGALSELNASQEGDYIGKTYFTEDSVAFKLDLRVDEVPIFKYDPNYSPGIPPIRVAEVTLEVLSPCCGGVLFGSQDHLRDFPANSPVKCWDCRGIQPWAKDEITGWFISADRASSLRPLALAYRAHGGPGGELDSLIWAGVFETKLQAAVGELLDKLKVPKDKRH